MVDVIVKASFFLAAGRLDDLEMLKALRVQNHVLKLRTSTRSLRSVPLKEAGGYRLFSNECFFQKGDSHAKRLECEF